MSLKGLLWVWNYSRTTGNERHVLMAIADEATDAGESTAAHRAIAKKAKCKSATVSRCICRIANRYPDELAIDARDGKANRYQLLFGKLCRWPRVTLIKQSRVTLIKQSRVTLIKQSRVPDQSDQGSSTVRTSFSLYGRTTTEALAAGGFGDWWRDTFPIYNQGAQSELTASDYDLIKKLLETRPGWQLQNMAIVLWLVSAIEDPWIAGSDRSVRVLRHKAGWLDMRLNNLPAWWFDCSHTPKCSQSSNCFEKAIHATS